MSKAEPIRFPLDELLEALVSNGFYFGVDTHLRLQQYLDWFVQKTDQEPATLKYQLAALLCSNDADQQQFYTLFDQTLAFYFTQKQETKTTEKDAASAGEKQKKSAKEEKPEPKAAPATTRAQTTQPTLTEGKSGPVRVELKFPSNDLRIWNLAEIDQAVRPLREKEWATVLEWDIPATIRSTIRSGGMPTFELRRRKRAPQYLLLIDERSPRDHLAGLYAELAIELNRRDVDAQHYFFDRIPGRCWKDRRNYGSYTNIESLQSEFPGSRLLVIGEAEGLLELPQLRPSNLAADLRDAWPQTALLCTRPTAEWGNAELALCQMFPVVPANAAGLASLTLQWAATEVYAPQYWKIKCPEATVPPVRVARPQDVEPVLENLRYYLGRDGFLWLCAAALYPELYYELTALLHDESIPPPAGQRTGDWDMNRVWWTALLRLSRLDWFRRGSIPLPAREQLRQYFGQNVSLEQRGKVWEQLVKLLEITSPPPGSFAADSLQVTLDWYKTEQQMANPQLTEVARQQLGAALQEKMQSAAINDPLARRVLQKPSQGTTADHPLFIGQVTADVIDIRSGPSDSDPVIGQLQKNTRVDIFVFSNDRNWYRIGENWWVSAHSVKTEQIFRRQIETLLQKGRVTVKSLNIRSGPSASDPVIGRLEQNTQVNIFEISNDRNWYRIGENWWVSANFVEREQATKPETQDGLRILWVDDNPENNSKERALLEDRFGVLFTISTGNNDALRLLASQQFDLVISDAVRGDDPEAGLKLLQTMQERRYVVPFFVYTSATNFEYFREVFKKAGADKVIDEPQKLIVFVEALVYTVRAAKQAKDKPIGEMPSQQEMENIAKTETQGIPPEEKSDQGIIEYPTIDHDAPQAEILVLHNEAADAEGCNALLHHLRPLEVRVWTLRDATEIADVTTWIRQKLDECQVVLPLVSADFFADNNPALPLLDEIVRRNNPRASFLVMPILLKAVNLKGTVFESLRTTRPMNGQYVFGEGQEDEHLANIAETLHKYINAIADKPAAPKKARAVKTAQHTSGKRKASPENPSSKQEQKQEKTTAAKEQIQQLIAEGRSEEALMLLAQHSNDALLLQARYNNGKKQFNMGLIEFAEWQRIQAQVSYAALEISEKVTPKSSSQQTQPSSQPKPKENTVFISYRYEDKSIKTAVKKYLEDNKMITFSDEDNMQAGESINDFMQKAFRENKYVLTIISKGYLVSGWGHQELSIASVVKPDTWIPVSIDNSYLETEFQIQAMTEVSAKVKKLKDQIKEALDHNINIQRFTDDLTRLQHLQSGFSTVIQKLKSKTVYNISGENFESGMAKVLEQIRQGNATQS